MDFIQFFILELIFVWFFGAGAAINEVIDPIVGVILAGWIQFIKKVSLVSRPQRLVSMFATEAAAALTGGIAQFWILDVWYIHNDVKKEDNEAEQQELQKNLRPEQDEPINKVGSDGVPTRLPEKATQEAAVSNIRSTPPLNIVAGTSRPRGR